MNITTIIFIILAILLVILLFWLFIQHINWKYCVKQFKKCNVIVSGKKGSGKDIIFQQVINTRDEDYYSNISYGGAYHEVKVINVSTHENDFEHLVNEQVKKYAHEFYEKRDIYISDGGVYLPSQLDSKLHKIYTSMPVFYALSRHLYNSNVHVNVQNLNRLWKSLREQADFYIDVKHTFKLFGFIFITKYVMYDKYESALNRVLPMKKSMMNKYQKALYEQFRATNGLIKVAYKISFKPQLKYNSRAFEDILLTGDRLIAD